MFGFEDGFVAVVLSAVDLDGAVIEHFSEAVAGGLVYFVEAFSGEADVEAGLEDAKGDFAATVVGDRNPKRWP